MKLRKILGILSMLALLTGMMSATSATWMTAKARLAQQMLDAAWQNSRALGRASRPWRWADMKTVGRLSIPSMNQSLIVLSDASGEAMAFGPGLIAGDPLQAETTTLAIGGHRDTHLAFMQNLRPGARLQLEALDGSSYHYTVMDKQIVDTRVQSLGIATQTPGLILVTCYPFNASQTGGPLRMVMRAAYRTSTTPGDRVSEAQTTDL